MNRKRTRNVESAILLLGMAWGLSQGWAERLDTTDRMTVKSLKFCTDIEDREPLEEGDVERL